MTMKVRRFLIWPVIAVVGVVLLHPTPAAAAGERIMIVGDSISQGSEGDHTWRYRLAQHLGGMVDFVGPWNGTYVLPATLPPPGGTTPPVFTGAYRPGIGFDSQHLSRWGWLMHQAKDVIAAQIGAHAPDVLLVELGFNDLGWGVSDANGLLADLRAFVANARAARPGIGIAVANVVHRTPLDVAPGLPGLITTYNQALAGAVGGLGVELVDIDSPYDEYRDTSDGLHPNIRGEYVIAKAFADVLSARFGLGGGYGPVPGVPPADLAPGPPATVTATAAGDYIRLVWSHVFGAHAYRVYQRNVTRGEAFRALPLPIGADSWNAGPMPAGERMEFRIATIRSAWTSDPSAVVASATRQLPVVPDLRVATSPDRPNAVTLSWGAVAGAEDYLVYAASGCDQIPPPASGYRLVQWGLGSRTTWTQESLFDTCVNYMVVASRYGGEGVRPTFGTRAVPFLHNTLHFQARARYFERAPEPGATVGRTSVGAGPDRGIVVARAYIRNVDLFTDMIGDHRSWDVHPQASAKMTFVWDTATGEVTVYVHRSCVLGASTPFGPVESTCRDALPVAFVGDAASTGDGDISPFNYVTVTRTLNGLNIGMAAINSWGRLVCLGEQCWGPDLGRINARVTLTPNGSTFASRLVGDRFPSWEIIRYPHYVQAQPAGQAFVIGTRGQTVIEDLKGAPSNCVNPAQEVPGSSTVPTISNPMIC